MNGMEAEHGTDPDPGVDPNEAGGSGADPVAALADAVEVLREQLERAHRRADELVEQLRSRADDPLVRDLVLLSDTCARTARDWDSRGTATPSDVADALNGVVGDVGRILDRAGVEEFGPMPGEPFDRRTSRAVRTAPAEDPASDGTVGTLLRPGYRSGERVLRYAEVVVLRGPR